MSAHYRNFANKYGFQHVTSSPYWSRSNGKIEAAVDDAISALKKSDDIYLTLLNRRNTAPRGYSFSPVQRLMGRQTRSTLPLSEDQLKPDTADPTTVTNEINQRREASKAQYDKFAQAPLPPLPVGSHAYAKPRPSQRGAPWIYGKVISTPAPRSYNIHTGTHVLRRNRAHLRPAAAPQHFPTEPPKPPIIHRVPMETLVESSTAEESHTQEETPPAPSSPPVKVHDDTPPPIPESTLEPSTQQTTRSGRLVRPPKKFDDFTRY